MPLKYCCWFKATFEVQYLFPGYEERLSKFHPNCFSLAIYNRRGKIQRKISSTIPQKIASNYNPVRPQDIMHLEEGVRVQS